MPQDSIDSLRHAGYALDEARHELQQAHISARESYVAGMAFDLLGLLNVALTTVFDLAAEEEDFDPPPVLRLT